MHMTPWPLDLLHNFFALTSLKRNSLSISSRLNISVILFLKKKKKKFREEHLSQTKIAKIDHTSKWNVILGSEYLPLYTGHKIRGSGLMGIVVGRHVLFHGRVGVA